MTMMDGVLLPMFLPFKLTPPGSPLSNALKPPLLVQRRTPLDCRSVHVRATTRAWPPSSWNASPRSRHGRRSPFFGDSFRTAEGDVSKQGETQVRLIYWLIFHHGRQGLMWYQFMSQNPRGDERG